MRPQWLCGNVKQKPKMSKAEQYLLSVRLVKLMCYVISTCLGSCWVVTFINQGSELVTEFPETAMRANMFVKTF